MEKRLSITYPIITSWSYQAALMAILQSNKMCEGWIYSNYIQIYAAKYLFGAPRDYVLDFFYNLYGDWQYLEHKTNPWIDYFRVPRDIILSKWDKVSEFIIQHIDKNMYVYFPLDTSFVSMHDLNSFHTGLFYGYDVDKAVFYYADNAKNGKYIFFEIPFSEVELATHSNIREHWTQLTHRSDDYDVTLFRVRGISDEQFDENCNPCLFNLLKVINDIKEYLLIGEFGMAYKENGYYFFGIDCYNSLLHYVNDVFDSQGSLNLRTVSCFLDHKRLMAKRFEYMKSNGIQCGKSGEQYVCIGKKIETVRNIMLKEKISMKYTQRNRNVICDILDDCRYQEQETLNKFLIDY